MLEHLRNWGVRLALDDFGTDYSSLSDLGRIQPDIIKIDPTFIGRLSADAYEYHHDLAIRLIGRDGRSNRTRTRTAYCGGPDSRCTVTVCFEPEGSR